MRTTLLASLVLLGACNIGTPGNPVLPIDAPPPIDGYVCDQPVTPGISGPTSGDSQLGDLHHPGQDCMSGCHDDAQGGDGAPTFTVAGTLYNGASGNQPVSGATIVITDSQGNTIRMATAKNGNFYTAATVVGSVQTFATECPKSRHMVGAATGSCNTSGCHDRTSAEAQTSPGRVFLQLAAP